MAIDLYESLDGQVALVTGASRGIGRELATGLVDLGATVYGAARNAEDVAAPSVEAVELDVTDDTQIERAISRVETERGRLDVLVNNAGIHGPGGAVGEAGIEGFDRTIATNVRGPYRLTQAALPLLLANPGGRVVNVSSRAGQFADGMDGGHAPYALSKAALNALTATLEGAYGDDGLLANAYCPGWVRTDMGGADAPRSPAEGADTGLYLARFQPGSPSGRFWAERSIIDW
jgi:hypothetical protein